MLRPRLAGLGAATLALCLASAPSFGQGPQPIVPDINERSGLLTRFIPIQPLLPKDTKRDTFYDTRWADSPNFGFPNRICTSGLYGLRYKPDCTASFNPYFYGVPGENTLRPECRPCRPLRFASNFVHPFRPVGHYYAGGSYVPVYDLDPWVPGPGPFPWPFFYRRPLGG
jgi:hypothetical protein